MNKFYKDLVDKGENVGPKKPYKAKELLKAIGDFNSMNYLDKIFIKIERFKELYSYNKSCIGTYISAYKVLEDMKAKNYDVHSSMKMLKNMIESLKIQNMEINRIIRLKGGKICIHSQKPN